MSTQINITVDRGGLLQRNRQQATANRQAAIEGQQRQQLQRQAEQQRRERLQQEANERARRRRNFVREEPAANRTTRQVGMSLGWVFKRGVAAQPLYFECQPENIDACNQSVNYGRFEIASGPLIKVRSGDGSSEQSFAATYDLSAYLSRPGNGADLSVPSTVDQPAFTSAPPITERLGPTNYFPTDLARITGWEVWLPVAPDVMVYAYRRKRVDGVQLLSTQRWRQCNYSSRTRINYYGLTTPVEVVTVHEKCFLISAQAVRELTMPNSLRDLLESTQPQWSVVSNNSRPINHSSVPITQTYFEGTPTTSNQYVGGWQWQYVAPTQSLQTLLAKQGEYYEVSPPLPPGYTLATAGVFRSLVDAPLPAKTPALMTNVNDASGFGSATTWAEIYAAATRFRHEALVGNAQANNLFMSDTRLPWPTDALTYLAPEGIALTSEWTATIGIGYDWGKPFYCSQGLSLLGFTEADLTP